MTSSNGKAKMDTYALVIGIEKYDIIPTANLRGPARDACRFTDWLLSRGVPPENIIFLLSPLDENIQYFEDWPGPHKGLATRKNIDEAINQRLPSWQGKLLYVFWGGHGISTTDRVRRLFYADTTTSDWHHLNLKSFLIYMCSRRIAFEQQIFIIDSCADYLKRFPRGLTGDTFLEETPNTLCQQFIFFATREGEIAKNNTEEQTGYFSNVILKALENTSPIPWPPDMQTLADNVRDHFATLNTRNAVEMQEPNYIVYRTGDGTEYPLYQKLSEKPLTNLQRTNRKRLLKRVRATWIVGLLDQSIDKAIWIDLGIREQLDVLDNPWRMIVQELNQSPHTLPDGTTILDVYDSGDGEMLLLGEPGSGKTTLLLTLACTLLDRAEIDEQQSIPVIFHLSSWASWTQQQQPFSLWLINELKDKYKISHEIAQTWINTDQIFPLLDGLDEVASEARISCVQAINSFIEQRQERGYNALVICCRSQDYHALSTRIMVARALSILPLTQEQIESYLQQVGAPLHALKEAMVQDEELRNLVCHPLMLSVIALISAGETSWSFTKDDSESTLHTIFARYTEKMLMRRGPLPPWMKSHFLSWLTYLAVQLHRRQQTIFQVEHLQADWLPSHLQQAFPWYVIMTFGLFIGLLFALGTLLFADWHAAMFIGLIFGFFFGWILSGRNIEPAEELTWSWEEYHSGLRSGIPLGLATGLFARAISNNWYRALLFGLSVFLVRGLLSGLSKKQISKHDDLRPNQGIWRSGRYGIIGVFIRGPITAAIVGSVAGLPGAVYGGLTAGPLFGFIYGLDAFLLHFLLRLCLRLSDTLPLRLIPFLNEATERLFFYRVGGDYIFVHRTLLDYLASLDPAYAITMSKKSSEINDEQKLINENQQGHHLEISRRKRRKAYAAKMRSRRLRRC